MLSYNQARTQIKSGDLLAFSHFGWSTWHDIKVQAVRMFTRSEYSHVGIAWVECNRVFVLEAVMPVVRIFPLSKLGEFYWMPTPTNYWNLEVEEQALSIVGEEYSQLQAVQSYFEQPELDKKWQCCEYAREILRYGGYDELLDVKPTPSNIVKAAQEAGFGFQLVKP